MIRLSTKGIAVVIESKQIVIGFGREGFMKDLADEFGGVVTDRPYRLPFDPLNEDD
jgi:hypothetical protein